MRGCWSCVGAALSASALPGLQYAARCTLKLHLAEPSVTAVGQVQAADGPDCWQTHVAVRGSALYGACQLRAALECLAGKLPRHGS